MANESAGHLELGFSPPRIERVGDLLDATLRVFRRHAGLIARIVLTVFLPVEIIKNYLVYAAGAQDSFRQLVRIEQLLEMVFGSFTTPALIYAMLTVFRTGKPPPLREAYRWGRRQWARVFGNRWLAGMAFLGGLLLLVFPGLMFAVWFSLVDPIVTIEGDQQPHVLRRSRELTKGRRWMLLGSGVVFFAFFLLGVFIAALPAALLDLDHWLLSAATDSLLEVWYQNLHIMLLLAYLSLRASQGEAQPIAGVEGPAQP